MVFVAVVLSAGFLVVDGTPIDRATDLAHAYLLKWPNEAVRKHVVEEMAKRRSPRSVPRLVAELSSRDIAHQASAALAEFGDAAIDPLDEATRSSNERVRYWAVRTLGDLGVSAQRSAPSIVGALDDASPLVRHNAIYALELIDPVLAVDVLSAFAERVEMPEFDRVLALHSLEALGTEALPARSALERLSRIECSNDIARVARSVIATFPPRPIDAPLRRSPSG